MRAVRSALEYLMAHLYVNCLKNNGPCVHHVYAPDGSLNIRIIKLYQEKEVQIFVDFDAKYHRLEQHIGNMLLDKIINGAQKSTVCRWNQVSSYRGL